MRPAFLFWFYKDIDLCLNRLRTLRRYGRAPIFGLYGGKPDGAEAFRRALSPHLDDFWSFDDDFDSQWKWVNGDLMLSAWFNRRGHALPWDTLFIAQWDHLVLDRIERILGDTKPGELLLSGLRPISEVRDWWFWTRDSERARFDEFHRYMECNFGAGHVELCCQFIVAALPRKLLEAYQTTGPLELGFLEYRLPAIAHAFGIPFSKESRYRIFWANEPGVPLDRTGRALNAEDLHVPMRVVAGELLKREGLRVFHPFTMHYPLSKPAWLRSVASDVVHTQLRRVRRMFGG